MMVSKSNLNLLFREIFQVNHDQPESHPIASMYMVSLPTFTMRIEQIKVNIQRMDGMGMVNCGI